MARYKIKVAKSVEKDLQDIPKSDLKKIIQKISSLESDPKPVGVQKLSGIDEKYRIRSGNYRIIYEINEKEKIVDVAKVGHRKDVYRK